MPYLKAFVRETFRVWPNGTEVSRFTEKDMVSSPEWKLHLTLLIKGLREQFFLVLW